MKYRVLLYYDELIKQWGCILQKKRGFWGKWKDIRRRMCNGEVVACRWSIEYDAYIVHIKDKGMPLLYYWV